MPVPVAAQSKTWVCCLSLAERLWVRIPPGAWMFDCYECCVLSGRVLCVKLIFRPEGYNLLRSVVVCDLKTSRKRRPWPTLGRRVIWGKIYEKYKMYVLFSS